MLALFQDHIARQQLCKTTDKILLAVSGGVDSMVMLHLFYESGYRNISVAHCNFQLRGREADNDERFVKQMCEQLHIPFFVTHFNTNNYAAEQGVSIQMAARELRYAWFNEMLEKEKFDLLATAHHLNDAVETVLLNLIHGRGIDGLTGIASKSKKLIRPLLFALRKDIESYAADESILWREDASNQTDDYKRNRIRHDVVPVLKALNPNLEITVQRGMHKNQGAAELVNFGVQSLEAKYVIRSLDRTSIHKDALTSFHHPSSVLYQLIKPYQFSVEQCDSIITSLYGHVGKFFRSSGYQLVIDRNDLVITAINDPLPEVRIQESQRHIVSGNWQLELSETSEVTKLNEVYKVALDADKITYPLVWRAWHDGDFFYPLGLDHRKKISDFLVDRKVVRSDKDQVMVIESAGEIIWVVGYQISNRFKITPDTKRAIHLHVGPYFI